LGAEEARRRLTREARRRPAIAASGQLVALGGLGVILLPSVGHSRCGLSR